MDISIAVLPGDGIGPEVMDGALLVLRRLVEVTGHTLSAQHGLIGGAAFDVYGEHFPEETAQICESAKAVLFGAVGGPVAEQTKAKWKNCEANSLLSLRKKFNFSANLRPVRVFSSLAEFCPLKQDIVSSGVDILFIRELVGDIYFGEHRSFSENGVRVAQDVARYDEKQIARVARVAFEAAKTRRGKVTSVDKANVLDTSKLWREVVEEIHQAEFSEVELEHMLVDNCAMQIIKNPSQFDVILTSNMFGDILSDAAAVLPGSLGLMPSASLSESGFSMYEGSGGSAPDIAGKGVANPCAQILSAAMMLRFSFSLDEEATNLERAVGETIQSGVRTADICLDRDKAVGTKEFSQRVASFL